MTNKKIPAPYAPVGNLSKAFNVLGKIKLNNIDKKTIRTYDIISQGNESKMIAALKFLGILDENNKVNIEKYNAFSYSGEKRKEELSKIIKEAYKELFETIPDLEMANFDIIKNFFISEYEYSGILAEASAKAFVFFCKEADISLPLEITNISEVKQRKRKKGENIKKPSQLRKKGEENKLESSDYDKIIFLTKESIKTEFPITCQEDWEDVKILLERKIERIFDNQGLHVPDKEAGSS